jgi:hypothetical protein
MPLTNVNSEAELNAAILADVATNTAYTIDITGGFVLTTALDGIGIANGSSLVINGGG